MSSLGIFRNGNGAGNSRRLGSGGGLNRLGSASDNFSLNTRRRGGGGQVLLQRPAPQLTKPQQSAPMLSKAKNQTFAKTKQHQQHTQRRASATEVAQKEDTDVALSMEEVLKDLEILAQQQRESQLKLQQARSAKKLSQEKNTQLVERLNGLRSTNARNRETVNRRLALADEAGKAACAMRKEVAGANSDLNRFHRDLQAALLAKAQVLCYEIKQKRQFDRIRPKMEILIKRRDVLSNYHTKAKERLEKAKNLQKSLRDDLHQEMLKQQDVSLEMSQENNKATQQEQVLRDAEKAEMDSKEEVRRLQESMTELIKHSDEAVAKVEADITQTQTDSENLREATSKADKSLKESRAELEKAATQHLDTLEKAGAPRKQQESGPPCWDKDAGDAMLQEGDKAIADEEKAIESVEKESGDLSSILESLESEEANVTQRAAQLNQVLEQRQADEAKRKSAQEQLQKKLEEERTEAKSRLQHVERIKAEREKQEEEERTEEQKLEEELTALEAEIGVVENELFDTGNELERAAHAHDSKQTSNKQATEKAETEIEEERKRIEETKSCADEIEKWLDQEGKKSTVDVIEAKCSELIRDWPDLSMIDLNVESTSMKTPTKLLQETCNKRVESAKKQHQEHEKAKKKLEEEALELQKAREEEEKRKEQARMRRKQREELKRRHDGGTRGVSKAQNPEDDDAQKDPAEPPPDDSIEENGGDGTPLLPVLGGFSAAKPRKLVDSFAQENESKATTPSATSSKKKVRWSDSAFVQEGDSPGHNTGAGKEKPPRSSALRHTNSQDPVREHDKETGSDTNDTLDHHSSTQSETMSGRASDSNRRSRSDPSLSSSKAVSTSDPQNDSRHSGKTRSKPGPEKVHKRKREEPSKKREKAEREPERHAKKQKTIEVTKPSKEGTSRRSEKESNEKANKDSERHQRQREELKVHRSKKRNTERSENVSEEVDIRTSKEPRAHAVSERRDDRTRNDPEKKDRETKHRKSSRSKSDVAASSSSKSSSAIDAEEKRSDLEGQPKSHKHKSKHSEQLHLSSRTKEVVPKVCDADKHRKSTKNRTTATEPKKSSDVNEHRSTKSATIAAYVEPKNSSRDALGKSSRSSKTVSEPKEATRKSGTTNHVSRKGTEAEEHRSDKHSTTEGARKVSSRGEEHRKSSKSKNRTTDAAPTKAVDGLKKSSKSSRTAGTGLPRATDDPSSNKIRSSRQEKGMSDAGAVRKSSDTTTRDMKKVEVVGHQKSKGKELGIGSTDDTETTKKKTSRGKSGESKGDATTVERKSSKSRSSGAEPRVPSDAKHKSKSREPELPAKHSSHTVGRRQSSKSTAVAQPGKKRGRQMAGISSMEGAPKPHRRRTTHKVQTTSFSDAPFSFL